MPYYRHRETGRVTLLNGALVGTPTAARIVATHDEIPQREGQSALAAQRDHDAYIAEILRDRRAAQPHACDLGGRPNADRWPVPLTNDNGDRTGWRLSRPAAVCGECQARHIPAWDSDGRAFWTPWPWHGWMTQPRAQAQAMRDVMRSAGMSIWPGLLATAFRNLLPVLLPILVGLAFTLAAVPGHTATVILAVLGLSTVLILLAQRGPFRSPEPLAIRWDHASAGAGGVMVLSVLVSAVVVTAQAVAAAA